MIQIIGPLQAEELFMASEDVIKALDQQDI